MIFLCKNRREAAKIFWGLFSPRSGENFLELILEKLAVRQKVKKTLSGILRFFFQHIFRLGCAVVEN